MVSTGLRVLGVGGGTVAGALALLRGGGRHPTDWALSAFGATGTMAGFMLAAFALVLAAKNNEELNSVFGTPTGDALIMALMSSMWAWGASATAALLYWLFEPDPLYAVFVGLCTIAAAEGFRAMFWVYAVARRYAGQRER